jgi:hypothetical protein
MLPVAVLDACVLYPASIRDLLVRLASAGAFRACWTRRILDECFSSIATTRPDLAGKLGRTRRLMEEALPDAMVSDDVALAATPVLPDENDRHVLAAAVRAGARVIVTMNLRDFPPEALAPLDVEAQHPDAFMLHLLSRDPGAVLRVVREQAAALKNPPSTLEQLLDVLETRGLVQTASR